MVQEGWEEEFKHQLQFLQVRLYIFIQVPREVQILVAGMAEEMVLLQVLVPVVVELSV